MIAGDYPFLDVLWTMFIFFAWVIWFWLLITVFADIFRRHEGWTPIHRIAGTGDEAVKRHRPVHDHLASVGAHNRAPFQKHGARAER